MSDEAEINIKVDEKEDGSAVIEFPDLAFSITLKELNWGLFEDIDRIQSAEGSDSMRAMVGFFNDHVEGGAKAVPIKHTGTAMNAVRAYMDHVNDSQKKTE